MLRAQARAAAVGDRRFAVDGPERASERANSKSEFLRARVCACVARPCCASRMNACPPETPRTTTAAATLTCLRHRRSSGRCRNRRTRRVAPRTENRAYFRTASSAEKKNKKNSVTKIGGTLSPYVPLPSPVKHKQRRRPASACSPHNKNKTDLEPAQATRGARERRRIS